MIAAEDKAIEYLRGRTNGRAAGKKIDRGRFQPIVDHGEGTVAAPNTNGFCFYAVGPDVQDGTVKQRSEFGIRCERSRRIRSPGVQKDAVEDKVRRAAS